MNHSIQRHRRLYCLLKDTGTEKFKDELVLSFSDGRTTHSSELSDPETDDLIRHLEKLSAPKAGNAIIPAVKKEGHTMRRRILSLCYVIGWTKWNDRTGRHTVDWDKLNAWMRKYSYLHQPLNDYTPRELQQLVKQFEYMSTAALSDKNTKANENISHDLDKL